MNGIRKKDERESRRLLQKAEMKMRIGYCQFDVQHKDIERNLRTIERMLAKTEADVVVLPELALTGYFFDKKEELAGLSTKKVTDDAFARLGEIAKKHVLIIVIGMSELADGKLYNTAYVIDETGIRGKQRKMHLTETENIFAAGKKVDVIETGGIKIGIAICFDIWFPEMCRVLADKGADVICCPANFGGPWSVDVAKVRALENSIPFVLANRTGEEIIKAVKEPFRGQSMVIDGYGRVLSKAKRKAKIGVVDVDLDAFSREKSPLSNNMRQERDKHTMDLCENLLSKSDENPR